MTEIADLPELLKQAERALLAVTSVEGELRSVSDAQLLHSAQMAEQISRRLDVVKLKIAAQVAARFVTSLGNQSLAARRGHLNAADLLRRVTRVSLSEAGRRIRVGEILSQTSDGDAGDAGVIDLGGAGASTDRAEDSGAHAAPFSAVVASVRAGAIGVEAADRIIRTLTPVVGSVDPQLLAQATATLAAEAANEHVDRVAVMARGVRDTLDRVGIGEREGQLRSRRSLRRSPVIDGLRRVSLVLDPESDAIISGAIDAAMSPRLGGPRFVDAAQAARATDELRDQRTNEQMALDVLVDLVRLGADADDGAILGVNKPAVRVAITLADLTAAMDAESDDRRQRPAGREAGYQPDSGVGWLEGSTELVSPATVRRFLCDRGAMPIILGGASEPIDVGRARRLFTGPQRVALALRDGGCRWPGCDRPPSWAEAHHIRPFAAGGKTDLADGVLLCRRHHLILHNNRWRVDRDDGEYWLTPPAEVDSQRERVPMPSKNPLHSRVKDGARAGAARAHQGEARVGGAPPTGTRSGQVARAEAGSGRVVRAEVRSGQVVRAEARSGQVVRAEVRSGRVVRAEVRSGQVVRAEVRSGRVVRAEVRSGQVVRAEARSGQVVRAEARSG